MEGGRCGRPEDCGIALHMLMTSLTVQYCVIAPDVCEHVCVQLHVNPMLYCVLQCFLLLVFHCFRLLCTVHMLVDLHVYNGAVLLCMNELS